jgi:tRNA nucleotidyltransferase (CCA-adding enzyme)
LLVGGGVRDRFVDPGLASKDIDVEVYGHSSLSGLANALSAQGCDVVEVGASFGVLKTRAGSTDLDISVPRRDSKIAAGHRGFSVEFDPAMTVAEASGRRDFTINALAWDPFSGHVIDCWGGLADIRAGVLRHTTEAFAEDPLRVLRGVQFAARFGYTLAPETAALCRRLAPAYGELPSERVWGEFEKLGRSGRDISAGLRALHDSGWERHFPQLADLHGVPQDPVFHPEGDVHTHAGLAADQAAGLADAAGLAGNDRLVVVLAALVHDFGKAAPGVTKRTSQKDDTIKITSYGHENKGIPRVQEFLRGIGCPGDLAQRIAPLVREHMCHVGAVPSRPVVNRLARRLGRATMDEWSLVCGADIAGRGNPEAVNPTTRWLDVAAELGVRQQPARGILTGHHLIAAGLRPGPVFGSILRAAVEAQDEGSIADEPSALRWLEDHLAAGYADSRHAPDVILAARDLASDAGSALEM